MTILPKSRNKNIVVRHLETETLIYDLAIDKAFCLNETSALVYRACDGKTALAELKREHKLTEEVIFLALDSLREENLLSAETNYQSPFRGLSRREAIRRVGFASLAVLPVVSALVAPSAAHAASPFAPRSRTLRQTCNNSAECAAGSPNCTNTPQGSGRRICCVSTDSRYDTGEVVNSCSGGGCSSATFQCQVGANTFCCSGQTQIVCPSANSCACQCL